MRSFKGLSISQINTRGKRSASERKHTQAKGERAVFDTRERAHIADDRARRTSSSTRAQSQPNFAILARFSKKLVTLAAALLIATLILASVWTLFGIGADIASAAGGIGETARVGGDSPLAYNGVNSMVGTLISWGADNYTTTNKTVGSWYIDNNGYIVWGSSGAHNLPITYAVPKDNSLSKIELIKAKNGATLIPGSIQTANGKQITIDNLVTIADGLGSYFTVGANGRTTPQQMAEDWEKAIVAASHYSKSGILQNSEFGTASSISQTEFPDDDTWAKDFNKQGATGGFGKQQNTDISNNTYIYIKLMADWVAPVVNTMTIGGTQSLPGESTKYLNRFVEEAKLKTAQDVTEETGVTRARGVGFFEFDLGSNGAGNTLQTGSNGSQTNPSYKFGDEEGASKDSGPHFSLGTSFSNKNSISNLNNNGIKYNQFSAVPSEEPFSFGRLAIPDNCYVIVDLNGHKLDRNLDEVDETIHKNVICPSVFLAGAYSRLEVFDSSATEKNPAGNGKIMGATGINGDGLIDGCPPDYVTRRDEGPAWNVDAWGNSMKGGGVKLAPRAEFTLHSGTITNNSALYGGAVYGTANNYIYVYDGVMTGNTACKGGATYLSSDSQMVFNMFGGSISGNGADWRRLTRYIHVKDTSQVTNPEVAIPEEWKNTGVGTGVREFGVTDGKEFNKEAWNNVVNYSKTTPKQNIKSGEINSEGGGVCVFKNTYFNMYGGSISNNYSLEYAGGVNVNINSFFKMYGGEITGNVVTGEIKEITGATIVPDRSKPTQTETPKANVGGGGVNMFQDSAGIYLNGPGKIMDNYTCNEKFDFGTKFSTESIANYLETNNETLADSNLYLSLTTSAHTQTTFATDKHLYPEIKVQGPLYIDAQHAAQISITPAAGIEAGGYIMRDFYAVGWEDSSSNQKAENTDGNKAPRYLGADETDHAKDQINVDGGTTFNSLKYLQTGAQAGYPDGFLFTDGGTSIVGGTGSNEGWLIALGTKDASALPVQWQYYDATIDPNTDQPYGWLNATTTGPEGTSFVLTYNGTNRIYDIRVRLDRGVLGAEASTSRYYYLYYDYFTTFDVGADGKDVENQEKHYFKLKGTGENTSIFTITAGINVDTGEPYKFEDGIVKYVSERYDLRNGYRFSINKDIDRLEIPGGGQAFPFTEKDAENFQPNPDYCGMRIVRATLQLAKLNLGDVERYYDGTKDFYIPSSKISQGSLTGYAPDDESNLLMQFQGEANGYVKGELVSPNVGQNSVQLAIKIAELGLGGGKSHDIDHDDNTFPDECLLANYEVYDQNSNMTTPAEDANIPITLNVNIQPKPITLNFVPQTVEYGSIPLFGEDWVSIEEQPDCSLAYKTDIESLFDPAEAKTPADKDFDPNALGKDGNFAKEDIELYSSANKALAAYQILGLSFTSTFAGNSGVGAYNYNLLYSNSNYAVTYNYKGAEYPAIQSGTAVTTVVLSDLFTVTPRNILLVVEDKESVYGEALKEVGIADQRHLVKEGETWKADSLEAIISGDSLQAEVNITADASDYNTDSTTGALKVGTYPISLVKDGNLNPNYNVVAIAKTAPAGGETYTAGGDIRNAATYTVTARPITLSVDELTSVYGDDLVADWQNKWTATGDGLTGDAILSYDRTNFAKAVQLAVSTFKKTGASAAEPYSATIKNAGEYGITLSYDDRADEICKNYQVKKTDGTYIVVKRAVTLTILSNQNSTYGEQITLTSTGKDSVWMATAVTNGNTLKGIIISEDEEKFASGIVLQFAYLSGDDWTATWDGILPSGKHVPAGQYAIIGTATENITDNYDITWFGAWSATSNTADAYKATEHAGKAGCYTINKRSITVQPVTLSTEYGDKPIDFANLKDVVSKLGTGNGGVALNGGDDALINDGYLPTAYWTATSSVGDGTAMLDGYALKIALATFSTNATKTSSVGISYTITADKAKYNADLGDNANYDVTFIDGTYSVTARNIKISSEVQYTIYGLLTDGHYEITFKAERVKKDLLYSDDDPHAFVESDRKAEPASDVGNVFTYTKNLDATGTLNVNGVNITLLGYQIALNGGSYLSASTHQLSVTTDSLANYSVNSEEMAKTYVVLKRAITVQINDQSAEYSSQVPSISQQQGKDWVATGFNTESEIYNDHDDLKALLSGENYILDQDLSTVSSWLTLNGSLSQNYGEYKIEGNCTNSNYDVKFVGSYGETDDGANDGTGGTYRITHIQIDAYFTGYEDTKSTHAYELTYDGQTHKLETMLYALGGGSARLPSSEEYTVVYSYKGFKGTFANDDDTSDGTHEFRDAGTYTVTITLKDDGASNYQFGDEEDKDSLTLTFTINKAEVSVLGLETVTFNRAIQLPTISFVNSERGNDAVPNNDGATKEWGVYYTPQNKWQTNPMPRSDKDTHFFGEPSYADVYNAYVMLLGDAQGNFKLTGANSEKKTLTELEEGSVGVITANDAEKPALENLSGAKLTFAEGCLISTTYTINQLEILLIKTKTTNVFDALTHLNDALEVRMQSVGTETALNDVPYKVVICKGDEVFAVFHYGLAKDHNNHAHLGKCTPECDAAGAPPHHHLHFDFENKDGDNPTDSNNGHIVWTNNDTDVWTDHDTIDTAFTNVGTFTLKLVLDNYNYKISDGKAAEKELAPDGKGTEDSYIQRDFTYAIEKAMLSPYLTKPDSKDAAESVRIEYDTQSHKLGVWFTCTNSFVDGLDSVLKLSAETFGDVKDTYINNFHTAWNYTGWSEDLTESGYKNVGTYTVTISLSSDSNFAFAGGNEATLTFEIVAYELKLADIDLADGFKFGDGEGNKNIVLSAGGNYVYTGMSADPIATMFELSGGGGTYKIAQQGKEQGGAKEFGYSVMNSGTGIDAGEYILTVQGMRNFTGTIELTLVIDKKDLGNKYDANASTWNEDGNNSSDIKETNLEKLDKVYTGTNKTFDVKVEYTATLPDASTYLNNLTGGDYTLKWFKQDGESWKEVNNSDVKMHDAGTYRVVIIARDKASGGTGNYSGAYVQEFSISPSKVVLKPNVDVHDGAIVFVYNGTQHVVGVTFNSSYATPGTHEYAVSEAVLAEKDNFSPEAQALISVNAGHYTITVTLTSPNFIWDEEQSGWTSFNAENSVAWNVESDKAAVHVKTDVGATTVTITYTINPATVEIESITSAQYNRQAHEEPQINFKNTDPASSVIPSSFEYTTFAISETQWLFKNFDASLGDIEEAANAKLGGTGDKYPYYAGNYDVTIKLTGDDARNFTLQQKEQYTHSFNDGEKTEDKTVSYTADDDPITATALFVIEQLGVFANGEVTSAIFDNVDHFMGDPEGLTIKGRYGGKGPWTINFSSLDGTTPLGGISYNIRYEGVSKKDGKTYTVTVKIGGYSHAGEQKLDPDAFYLQEEGQDKAELSDFEAIQEHGFFTDAKTYQYTLSFDDANFFISTGSGMAKSKELEFVINPAQISLGTLDHLTFNNSAQDAPFKEGSFTPVGDTTLTTLDAAAIWNLLNGGGYEITSYVANAGNAKLADGENKPFNAGDYTVNVQLLTDNFKFSGSDTSSTSFTIDPFDISTLTGDGQFVAELPDVKYTGMAMQTYIKQATLRIGEQSVKLVLLQADVKDGAKLLGDDGYELTITRYSNNINVVRDTTPSKTAQKKAEAFITGSGNFTGEIMQLFAILPREVNVHINSIEGNVYGVNLCVDKDVPANLGKLKGTDWTVGDENELSADEINDWITKSTPNAYGTSNQADINEKLAQFETFQSKAFVYSGDDLAVSLSIQDGNYNDKMGATHSALLVGNYRIVGFHGNENYDVKFSGDYKTKMSSETDDDAHYGYYQVVPREISITPADLGIVYGHATHEYAQNATQDGSQLFWTASANYGGEAILERDLSAVTAGIKLEIANETFTHEWLNVGTYKINVQWTASLVDGDDEMGNKVRACYTVTPAGTWTNDAAGYAISSASEAVTIGTGGTYTVTPREVTLTIKSGVMKYEYDATSVDDMLAFMLGQFETTYASENVEQRYTHIFTAAKGANIEGEANWYAEGDGFASLNIKLKKDAGADVSHYSVTPSYENANYTVTFEGASNSVEITKRLIIVHINDQTQVYGDAETVGETEGKEYNWYAMLSEDSSYWTESLRSDLDDRIAQGRLNSDDLGLNLQKELGANVGKYYIKGTYTNGNYDVTFEGNWTAAQSTTDGTSGDPEDNKAGIYEITPRPVKVIIKGQSGVYGGNQLTAIGATENTHWNVAPAAGEFKDVVNNDNLNISISIVIPEGGATSKAGQLNVGWYSVRVSYANANYTVTVEGDNSNLSGAQYVTGYAEHNSANVTSASEAAKGDEVAAYDITDIYCVYARLISISVNPQSVTYTGEEPTIQQGASYWSASNVVNGDMPALVEGDEADFNAAIELYVVAPVNGDPMYAVWKLWGMWSAGSYNSGNCGINARFKAGANETIIQNYAIAKGQCAVLRIDPTNISVAHNGQHSVYNKKAPVIEQENYTITGKVCDSRKWDGSSGFKAEVESDKDKLNFTFEYEGTDYSAGNHRITGRWTEDDHNPNYTVTFNPATYKIDKRELKVTINDLYVIYGEKLWTGDEWWTTDDSGTQIPNPTYWSVEVSNPNAGDEGVCWMDEPDRQALGISPDSKAQQRAGKYQIAGSWNGSDNYTVTFVGSWKKEDDGKGMGGTYTVHQRAIIVHINDQDGVYGGSSFTSLVNQSMGTGADNDGWYVVDFDYDEQKKLCKEHECSVSGKPRLETDTLFITLSIDNDAVDPKNYNITGRCDDKNYAVTWVGGKNLGDGENYDYERDHGLFGIQKREVTVNVNDQTVKYGALKGGATTGFNVNGYTASPHNDPSSSVAFVDADDVVVELSVTVTHSGASNYNQAGRYAITIRIYEGGKAGKLIYSSLTSEHLETSDKYEIDVTGKWADKDFENNGSVSGNTGAYVVEKLDLTITVLDKSSVYGEEIREWEFSMNGNMPDEESFIKEHVQLTIGGENYATWSAKHQPAGGYNISAKLEETSITNNYNVVFRTQNGVAYDEVSEEKTTAMYTVTKRTLTVNITRISSVYGDELTAFLHELSPVGILHGDLILSEDGDLGISFSILGADKNYNLSTTEHLKAGVYPIIGTWEENPNYAISFTGSWLSANTDTWLKQASQNAGLYENVHDVLDNRVGLYEVETRKLTVTLGKTAPSSEYGDKIVDFDGKINTDRTWGASYDGLVSKGEKQDNILFNMTTTAREGSDAKAYPITIVKGSDDGGDNANYNITFVEGTYTIKQRQMEVKLTALGTLSEDKYATDVYGTTYEQEKKFKYVFYRKGTEALDVSTGLYGDDSITLTIEPITAEGFRKTATGFYSVGTYMLRITATDNSNYVFTGMDGIDMRYVVTKSPLTIYVNEQSSVYGENIVVHQGQGEGEGFGWHVVEGTIVTGNGTTDDLGIEITKAAGDKWAENGYMLTATAKTASNYAITWKGNWKDDDAHGTYTIKKRLILIRILNQYSIYGENIKVSSESAAWAVVAPSEIKDAHGKTYYTLIEGQTPGITLNIFTEADGVKTWYTEGVLSRGEYRIGVQSITNNDYDVEVEDNYLPAVSDTEHRGYLKEKFDKDFGNPTSKNTIEVINPVISKELAESYDGTYFVTIRPITIRINDQSGVYGDYLTLNQKEGTLEAYNIELGANTTNTPFIGDYRATFDLVTTAIQGSDISGANPKGVTAGWSLGATTYPIFGDAYHVYVKGVEIKGDEATELSHNYQFNFEGAYTGEETYPSGTTFNGRAGVYTVIPRQVTLTANNSSEVYGGNSAIEAFPYIPALNQLGYNAIVSNSKVSTDGMGETHGAILDGDLAGLNITLTLDYKEGEDFSAAKALKVGKYVIKLTYDSSPNYEITAVNGEFEVLVRPASIIIGQRAASATYLANIPSQWTYADESLYTRSNVLDGDVIAFTMKTLAKQGDPVGSEYELSGTIGDVKAGDNANYSITFTNGTFEITRKKVEVKIIDQSSEYGNDVIVDGKGGWELPADWNKDALSGYSNNDNADELGIKLSTSATKFTDVGNYQIEGQYDLHNVGKNYELQFVGSWNSSNEDRTNGNGGTLTIYARKLIVVIKAQAQEYRSSYALSPNEWFAWRDGHKATWNGEETVDEGGVLGGDDKLGDLRIDLKRGGATDKADLGDNTNMDTYFGTYAIVGSSTASNYDITFAYERAEQPNFNYGDVKTSEDGVFNITAYKITIKVLDLGMNDAAVQYGAYKFGAALTNEKDVIWEYADEGREFLPTELSYLTFSLGGDGIACDAYAFVGDHPIVGYWGKGLEDKNANDYRMQFNYEVTFVGDWSSVSNNPRNLGYEALYKNEGETAYLKCGIIQISPADITALNYDQEYQDGEDNGSHWHGNNWTREAVFSGDEAENPKHSMAVGAADFAFAGDVSFDGRAGEQFGGHDNTVLQGKATVTYSDLTHNGEAVTWKDASVAPEEQAVGIWTVNVTVKAPYHNDANFTLTLDISRLDITIYLTSEKIHFDYGVYKLADGVITSTNKTDFSEVLKNLLFGNDATGGNVYLDKAHEGGAIVGAEDLGELEDVMKYLLTSAEVKLSISTRLTDASTGGYLIVNPVGYALTIDAGDNMSIHFGGEYYNVVIDAKPLSADWRSDPKADAQTLEGFDKVAYVYTFNSREISVVPHVMHGDILAGDNVLYNDDLGASIFDYALYKLEKGEYVPISANTVLDVGTYKALIRVNLSPTSNNVDIGNYTTPEDWVYIVVRPATLTVVVENQSREYDEYSPTLDQHAWYIKTGDPSKDVTGGDHPTATPTGEPLSALGVTLSFVDKDVLNAGKYEILATYASVNYDIVFEGAFGAESGKMGTSGIFEITRREVRVRVNNFSFVYGNDIPDNLADDANGYTCIHLVNGEERPNEIAVLPRDNISLNIAINGVQKTQTGYVKAGEYNVKLSYSNSNYNVHFADSDGDPEGAGAFSVKVNVAKAVLNVSIHGRQVRYGDLRPEMPENYTITGLAADDHAYYEAKGLKRPEFINFLINNADTGVPLKEFDAGLREDLMFDDVAVYIIMGNVEEHAADYADIGVNYDVSFSGEWAAYGRYLTDEFVGKASKYEVVPRDIGITIDSVRSQYGDALTDEEIPFTLQEGANNKLAGDDKLEDLHVTFHTEAIIYVGGQRRTNIVNTYKIDEPVAGNRNYNILTYSAGYYTITPREIILKVQDMTRPYGDDHAAHVSGFGYGNGWTAERYGDKVGAGVAYDDDRIKQEVKLGTAAGERSAVGDYDLTVVTMPYDSNYSVKEVVNGKYTVAKRRVALDIDSQEGEYGDSHELGRHFNFTLLSTDSNKPTLAVVFTTDAINLLELFFTDEITARTPAGDYRIDARYTDSNYDVTVTGKYLDGERQYGKYTVTPRDIVITLLGTQQSEYGDPVVASSEYGEGWTIARPEGKGGNALVNEDTITLELVVLDELAKVVDSAYSVGKYAVVVKSADISSNYKVVYRTQEGGAYDGDVYGHADDVKAVYNIIPRDITVEFGGESEYGDPVEVHDVSFRANGKEGEGIVNGDKLGFDWEWGAQGDPTNGGAKLADVGQYAIRLKDTSDANAEKARKNYNITTSENSFYHVVPRKVIVRVKDINKTYGDAFEDPNDRREELLEVSRATQGATGDAILNDDIRFFSLSVVNGDNILLTDGRPVNAGVYNFKLVYTDNNKNYDISVEYGHYTLAPKPVTVNIDSKTSKYAEDVVALTYGEAAGVLEGDSLNVSLSVLWLDEELGLEWHNAGVYAIKGVWDNPNYAVTFKGAMGEFGAYTVQKADNMFTKEYSGNCTVYLGDGYRDGDLPTALWGNDGARLEYYLDEAMTQKADFDDILSAVEGTYYVKAIVDEGANWTGAVTSFIVNVVDEQGFSDGLDITAYVCVFASQFIILACALIFIRRKKEKNKKTNTTKAGN